MTIPKTLTCLAALALLVSADVQAQTTRVGPADVPVAWSTFIGDQLAGSLESPIAEIRYRALEQVTYLATHGPGVDLSKTIPVLLRIYRTDAEEPCRLAAVSALHALADEDALVELRRGLYHQPSPRVQLAALGTLMAYYGAATFADDIAVARLAEQIRDHAVMFDTARTPAPVVAAKQ